MRRVDYSTMHRIGIELASHNALHSSSSTHSVCVCLSVTNLEGTMGTRRAELRFLQKALDVGNKINVGFLF